MMYCIFTSLKLSILFCICINLGGGAGRQQNKNTAKQTTTKNNKNNKQTNKRKTQTNQNKQENNFSSWHYCNECAEQTGKQYVEMLYQLGLYWNLSCVWYHAVISLKLYNRQQVFKILIWYQAGRSASILEDKVRILNKWNKWEKEAIINRKQFNQNK